MGYTHFGTFEFTNSIRGFFETHFLYPDRPSPCYDANLSGRTQGLVLPAWTTSELCDLLTMGQAGKVVLSTVKYLDDAVAVGNTSLGNVHS